MHLESDNDSLRDQLQAFFVDDEIKSFEGGKYTNDVREVYYNLIGKGVAIQNVETVIQTVLKKLAKKKVGRLPRKSLSTVIMIECELLAKYKLEKQSWKEEITLYILMEHRKGSMNMLHFK